MTNQQLNSLTSLSTEHARLIALGAHAHAMSDALELLTPAEILELRAEAAAMTDEQVEAMLIELHILKVAA